MVFPEHAAPQMTESALAIVSRADQVATVSPMDERSFSVVSRLDEVGSVLRRGCIALGAASEACRSVCQFAPVLATATEALTTVQGEEAEEINPRTMLEEQPLICSDNNMLRAFEGLGVAPERALIVSVGAPKNELDRIGFLDDPDVAGQVNRNPYGWHEIGGNPPYNAFFAYDDAVLAEGGEPIQFLGARLADSGFVTIRLKDQFGRGVTGIVHYTRTNMRGHNHLHEYDGVPQTFMDYVLGTAMRHYGARGEDVQIFLKAAVGPESWRKRFPGREKMDEVLRGWGEDGLIENHTNPVWIYGQEVSHIETTPEGPITVMDELWPHYPDLIRRDIRVAALVKGVPEASVYLYDDLDPGKPHDGSFHSSDDALQRGDAVFIPPASVARDLYGARVMQRDELDLAA